MRTAEMQLETLAVARWPESEADDSPPPLAGFVVSSFSPLVVAVAERCLGRVYGTTPADERGARTAVVLVSSTRDAATAAEVARAVDSGRRVGPLLFFQSVPNAAAGYVAARWGLAGPVACLSPVTEPLVDGLALAALLIEDGDADEALVLLVDQACVDGEQDSAEAVLVCRGVEL